MVQPEGLELIHPDAVVVGELGLWTDDAHRQAAFRQLSAQGEACRSAACNANVHRG